MDTPGQEVGWAGVLLGPQLRMLWLSWWMDLGTRSLRGTGPHWV